MTLRHPRLSFSRGALVFPGGKVDPADGDPGLRSLAIGAEGLADFALAARVAALRELFEEAGVLIAQERNGAPVDVGRSAAISRCWRRAVHDGEATMLDLAREEGLQLPLDALASFAHWITPERSPRRFDTYFFLAAAPVGVERAMTAARPSTRPGCTPTARSPTQPPAAGRSCSRPGRRSASSRAAGRSRRRSSRRRHSRSVRSARPMSSGTVARSCAFPTIWATLSPRCRRATEAGRLSNEKPETCHVRRPAVQRPQGA